MKIRRARAGDTANNSWTLAVAATVLGLPNLASAQPVYNIEAFCELKATAGVSVDGGWTAPGADPRSQVVFCLERERAAKNDIASRWPSIPESVGRSCEVVAPDYVALQKCLNGE